VGAKAASPGLRETAERVRNPGGGAAVDVTVHGTWRSPGSCRHGTKNLGMPDPTDHEGSA
jgi:hypothetical protein